ncbi:MAG TPA: hypothetical protein VFB51_05985 [Solirubrobacterales bacterium]|nr:hypothetical protein [Solirubrobacterales bacterium]
MRRLLFVSALVLALLPATAHAAYPGANGKIAYVDGPQGIWTMNPNGSTKTQITTGADSAPAWSPDGTRIAFHRKVNPACSGSCAADVHIANADGSNATLAISGAQDPSWSPGGDQLVFMSGRHIYKANLDGSGRTLLFDYEDEIDFVDIGAPAWAPDETATIAFHEGTLAVSCNPDLEECANYYPEKLYYASSEAYSPYFTGPPEPRLHGAAPNWSPDGERLAFFTPQWGSGEFPGDPGGRIGVMNRDGSQRQLLTPGPPNGFDSQPAWSPDASRIVFARTNDGIHVIDADGAGDIRISTTGTAPDWQPLPVNSASTYVRPKSATEVRVSLVPAFRACTAPNREHGPPLAFGSCAPPLPEPESRLTVGIGDGNPALANSTGFMRMRAVTGAPGPPDDSDVSVRVVLTNVMRRNDLSEYTGELRGEVMVRRTDREPVSVGSTTLDVPVGFTVPCSPTPGSSTEAAKCITTTSVDALIPGTIKDGYRTVWELEKVRVYDGGPDENADTDFGRTLFATQGVFVP